MARLVPTHFTSLAGISVMPATGRALASARVAAYTRALGAAQTSTNAGTLASRCAS